MFKRDIAQQTVGKADSPAQNESLSRRSEQSVSSSMVEPWGWPKSGDEGRTQVPLWAVFKRMIWKSKKLNKKIK